MAALISVVAVIAITGISMVFATQWVEAVSRTASNGMQANKLEDESSARAHIFSFGLENASYGPLVNSTGAEKSQNRIPR